MHLADQGITARFTAQLSKLLKGVKAALEYKWGLRPLASFVSYKALTYIYIVVQKELFYSSEEFSGYFFCTFVFLTC